MGAGSGRAIAHMTSLLNPLSGTDEGGIMDTRMDCNFLQFTAATNISGIN